MKLFCQRANDDFMALWITALYYSALLYTHSTIEQIAQKCRMTTKKTGNASKYALSKEIFSSLKLQTSSGEGGTPHAMQETQIFKSLGFFLSIFPYNWSKDYFSLGLDQKSVTPSFQALIEYISAVRPLQHFSHFGNNFEDWCSGKEKKDHHYIFLSKSLIFLYSISSDTL